MTIKNCWKVERRAKDKIENFKPLHTFKYFTKF